MKMLGLLRLLVIADNPNLMGCCNNKTGCSMRHSTHITHGWGNRVAVPVYVSRGVPAMNYTACSLAITCLPR